MPFYIRDLTIFRFWYLGVSWNQSPHRMKQRKPLKNEVGEMGEDFKDCGIGNLWKSTSRIREAELCFLSKENSCNSKTWSLDSKINPPFLTLFWF